MSGNADKSLIKFTMKVFCPWCGKEGRVNTQFPTITVDCDDCESTTEVKAIT